MIFNITYKHPHSEVRRQVMQNILLQRQIMARHTINENVDMGFMQSEADSRACLEAAT